MKIFVFGNEYIKSDSLAKDLAKEINKKHLEFIDCKSVNDLFESGEKNPIILDVVQNIQEPILIKNIDQLAEQKSSSAHDMDLGFHLKLYKELGMVKEVKIIGIPMITKVEEIKIKVEKLIDSIPN